MKNFFLNEKDFNKNKIDILYLIISILVLFSVIVLSLSNWSKISRTELVIFPFFSILILLFLLPLTISKILSFLVILSKRKNYLPYYLSAFNYILEDKEEILNETEYLKDYFHKTFGMEFMEKSMKIIISEYKNKTTDFFKLNKDIYHSSDKLQFINRLVHLAASDDNFDSTERKKILEISHFLKIPDLTTNKIISKFVPEESSETDFFSFFDFDIPATSKKQDIGSAYKILGINENSTAEQIKSSYRKLVKAYHPDKFQNKSIEKQQEAEDMFIKIQQAYELIEDNLN